MTLTEEETSGKDHLVQREGTHIFFYSWDVLFVRTILQFVPTIGIGIRLLEVSIACQRSLCI